jgi:hypothetical protein
VDGLVGSCAGRDARSRHGQDSNTDATLDKITRVRVPLR